jgi:hypothetical protein
LQPQTLPEGYALDRAVYDPSSGGITLLYGTGADSRADSDPKLVIGEQPAQSAADPNFEGYPASAIEHIQVGPAQAILVSGVVEDGEYKDLPRFYLLWKNGEVRIIMWNVVRDYQAGMEKEEFLAIAESMQ